MVQRAKGFTLIELMIVVAIIGIIAAFAYPMYIEQVKQARQSDGQGALVSLANAMERYYTQNNTFVGAAVGGAGIFPNQVPVEGGAAYYNLSIFASTATTYTLRAIPTGAQVGEGCIELLSIGTQNLYGADDCSGTPGTW